jgi:cell fate regulator YaaT (PSP1 superfamily)
MGYEEYLVGYGLCGEFGRFAAQEPLACRPGDKVMVQTRRGVEMGTVLCPATEGHLRVLAAQPVRPLLRRATLQDEAEQRGLLQTAESAFVAAQELIRKHALPLQVLDVEALAEPPLLVVHYVGQRTDYRDLVHGLSTRFARHVEMLDLNALPGDFAPEDTGDACGTCGSANDCGSCSSGACGRGGCGACAAPARDEVARHFAELGQRW